MLLDRDFLNSAPGLCTENFGSLVYRRKHKSEWYKPNDGSEFNSQQAYLKKDRNYMY